MPRMTADTVAEKVREIQSVKFQEKGSLTQDDRDLIASYDHALDCIDGWSEKLFVAKAIRTLTRALNSRSSSHPLDEIECNGMLNWGPPAILMAMNIVLREFEVKKRN